MAVVEREKADTDNSRPGAFQDNDGPAYGPSEEQEKLA